MSWPRMIASLRPTRESDSPSHGGPVRTLVVFLERRGAQPRIRVASDAFCDAHQHLATEAGRLTPAA